MQGARQQGRGPVISCSGAGSCALKGLEKLTLKFQRYVVLDAKRQQTGSLQVKTDLCQGSYRPRT